MRNMTKKCCLFFPNPWLPWRCLYLQAMRPVFIICFSCVCSNWLPYCDNCTGLKKISFYHHITHIWCMGSQNKKLARVLYCEPLHFQSSKIIFILHYSVVNALKQYFTTATSKETCMQQITHQLVNRSTNSKFRRSSKSYFLEHSRAFRFLWKKICSRIWTSCAQKIIFNFHA